MRPLSYDAVRESYTQHFTPVSAALFTGAFVSTLVRDKPVPSGIDAFTAYVGTNLLLNLSSMAGDKVAAYRGLGPSPAPLGCVGLYRFPCTPTDFKNITLDAIAFGAQLVAFSAILHHTHCMQTTSIEVAEYWLIGCAVGLGNCGLVLLMENV